MLGVVGVFAYILFALVTGALVWVIGELNKEMADSKRQTQLGTKAHR